MESQKSEALSTGLTDFRKILKLQCLVFIGFVALAGCGVTYTSPSVKTDEASAPVTVIALTPVAISQANKSNYNPRQLPAVFYSVAGNGSLRGTGALPTAPNVPDENPERAVLKLPPDIEPEPYRIGVGDVVLLATRGSPSTIEQLSGLLAAQNSRQGYTVRDDGAIAIPEVGTVTIAGMTLVEAEDGLFNALVENAIDPSFSLEVAEYNSQKIAVGGAVESSRLLPITLTPLNLGDALVAVGGIKIRDEKFATIRIYRDGTLYQIPVDVYRKRPDLRDILLQNGDAIYVDSTYDLDRAFAYFKQKIDVIALRSSARSSALNALQSEIEIQRAALQERRKIFESRAAFDAEDRDYVYLTGEVSNQSRVALPYGRQATLADVLYDEGGFKTTTGDPAQIYVLRAGSAASSAVTAYHLDATNVTNLVLATRLQMRPNDIVFIEEQVITKWNRALQQFFPIALGAAANSAN